MAGWAVSLGIAAMVAGATSSPPPIQRPATGDASDPATEPDEPATTDTAERSATDGPPELPPIGEEVPPPEPDTVGPQPEERPFPDGLLPVTSDELLPPVAPATDALALKLRAVEGQVAVVRMVGGSDVIGIVRNVGPENIAIVDRGSGEITIYPRREVAGVRMRGTDDVPQHTGVGLIAGGSVLASVGTPLLATGLAFLIIIPSEPALHVPLNLFGLGALGGGIAMIVKGAQRKRAYNEAVQGSVAWTPSGLRF